MVNLNVENDTWIKPFSECFCPGFFFDEEGDESAVS